MDQIQAAYSSQEFIEMYSKNNSLQKGEIQIFEKFKDEIQKGKTLDIGIGTGRTTTVLSKLRYSVKGIASLLI